MSFRLFGALLSGLLVTELVYFYITLSFVLPVIVGVLFTLLHALIQSYVLTMLVALYYGEVSEPVQPKAPKANVTKMPLRLDFIRRSIMKTLNIKKALSALLVMLMLTFAVAVPAFAAGPDAQPAENRRSQSAEPPRPRPRA